MAKDTNIILRTSPDEKEAFERAAEISGLSLSAWIRQRLRKASASELKSNGEKAKFLD